MNDTKYICRLYLFLSEMYTYIKLSALWLNKDKILNLIEYLHREEFKPSEVEHREILRKSITTARMVMTYYSAICVGAVSGTVSYLPCLAFIPYD